MIKIAVIGWRNFLSVNDAITEHCREVYRRLAEKGWQFIIFVKKGTTDVSEYKGIQIVSIPTIKIKFLETPIYCLLSFLWLITYRSKKDTIVHLHTIGCGIILPLLKFVGYKVVTTHHGPDYVRVKWNFIERAVLKLCEHFVVSLSDEVFCIATWVKQYIEQKYNRAVVCTPNGLFLRARTMTKNYLKKFLLEQYRYFLSVGNLVPEKGFLDIVLSFNKLEKNNGWKLVLVVLPEYRDKKYTAKVLNEAKRNKDIVIIENSDQEMLNELFSNAGTFISASSYESAPTYLITAIGYNIPTIATSIEANIVVGKEYPYYYPQGNIFALNYYMEKVVYNELKFNTFNSQLLRGYDWEEISSVIEESYKNLFTQW
jgi:glycosyltransferase involved in cell wall biosynthesis